MTKKILSFFIGLTFIVCIFSLTAFSEDYEIYDDQEEYLYDDPAPVEPTTKKTMTTSPSGNFNISGGSDIFGKIGQTIEEGINKLMEGLNGETPTKSPNSQQPTPTAPQTNASVNTQSSYNPGSYNSNSSVNTNQNVGQANGTTPPVSQAQPVAPTTQSPTTTEPGTLAVISNEKETLSGSTLTAIAFVGGIVILILVLALILVILTRRTEFDSKVKKRTTLPNAEDTRVPYDLTNDDIVDDGKDYANILPEDMYAKEQNNEDDVYSPDNNNQGVKSSLSDDIDALYDGLDDILDKYK